MIFRGVGAFIVLCAHVRENGLRSVETVCDEAFWHGSGAEVAITEAWRGCRGDGAVWGRTGGSQSRTSGRTSAGARAQLATCLGVGASLAVVNCRAGRLHCRYHRTRRYHRSATEVKEAATVVGHSPTLAHLRQHAHRPCRQLTPPPPPRLGVFLLIFCCLAISPNFDPN